MDKEKARFILHSFRPDGADVDDPDFAEALKLAMENRELGEWLAKERAFDSMFAQALTAVELPEDLRQNVLDCLTIERGDFPQAEDSTDAAWIGALASIHPPANFRDELLAAMERTVAVEQTQSSRSFFRRVAVPLSAAAGIALALIVTRSNVGEGVARTLPIETVQAGFVRTYVSPAFEFEEKNENALALMDHVRSKKLPCPGKLPPGLRDKKGLGCRELEVDGKKGSLICFQVEETKVVHVLVFRREDVSGDFPAKDHPEFARRGNWATARWEDGGKVFLMLSDTMGDKLPELF